MILIQFILVHYAFILIAEKYQVRGRLLNVSQVLGRKKITAFIGKFLYNVSECKFCITHHIGALLLPFLIMGNGFSWIFILYPLMSAGALFLLTGEGKKL
jgi:hypothetical protein